MELIGHALVAFHLGLLIKHVCSLSILIRIKQKQINVRHPYVTLYCYYNFKILNL